MRCRGRAVAYARRVTHGSRCASRVSRALSHPPPKDLLDGVILRRPFLMVGTSPFLISELFAGLGRFIFACAMWVIAAYPGNCEPPPALRRMQKKGRRRPHINCQRSRIDSRGERGSESERAPAEVDQAPAGAEPVSQAREPRRTGHVPR